jgi:hypothetical protein
VIDSHKRSRRNKTHGGGKLHTDVAKNNHSGLSKLKSELSYLLA